MRNKDFEIVRQYLYDTFDITDIVYLFYQGVIVGSEFLTYASTKLYLCHTISTVGNLVAGGFAVCGTFFYNESNNVSHRMNFAQGYYNSGTPGINNNPVTAFEKNLYFSRLSVGASITEICFKGYRITIP